MEKSSYLPCEDLLSALATYRVGASTNQPVAYRTFVNSVTDICGQWNP